MDEMANLNQELAQNEDQLQMKINIFLNQSRAANYAETLFPDLIRATYEV